MFTAALFLTAKKWKYPKCPSGENWINIRWHNHRVEYYAAIKRNEVLIDATVRMNLEHINAK